jgi:cytochrome c oxidase assembly factor CtaG/polyferredoxin
VNSFTSAALSSWNFDPRLIAVLLLLGVVYLRGWIRGRRILRDHRDEQRLIFFLAALFVLFAALASPLDALDNLSLAAHMTQHLLLMMIAPPLVLLSEPFLPLLRGLPKTFVKEGLGPFLTWPLLRRFFARLTAPSVAWLIFAVSTIGWHLPGPYEKALASPAWHAAQHASFFWSGTLFWWPIIRPTPGRYKWPLWIGIPYLLSADLINTALSAFFIFSGRVLYPSYEAIRLGGMTAREDQTLAGGIMWVPGSVIYLLPAVVIAMKLLSPVRPTLAGRPVRHQPRKQTRSALTRFQAPRLRRVAQAFMLLIAVAVMANGFFGTQAAPLNLAGVLPWIHWRALSILALLFVGNLFCMVCPFTFVRDFGRRVLPARLRWPRALRNKWLPVVLLILYFWTYEAFSLWNSPWLTAAIIAGYFVSALAIDGLFRGASFCKYVCPIGQFHFVASLVSPREVRVRKQAICQGCRTYDCIRGNAHARGCELDLFQPKKSGNLDCTFCLDCVKACPHDNVGLVSIAPGTTLIADPYRSSIGKLSTRADFTALALLIVFGAFVNAAGMVSPVMMWEHAWHARLGAHSMPVVIGAVVLAGAVIAPALSVALCRWLNHLVKVEAVSRRFVFALVPVGIAMWAAHLLFHFASAVPNPVSAWLTPFQLLILDSGLLLTLYVCWRIARQMLEDTLRALTLALPWTVLSCLLYAAGVWILFQPMQMRGMMN